jgi:hypothetical protein
VEVAGPDQNRGRAAQPDHLSRLVGLPDVLEQPGSRPRDGYVAILKSRRSRPGMMSSATRASGSWAKPTKVRGLRPRPARSRRSQPGRCSSTVFRMRATGLRSGEFLTKPLPSGGSSAAAADPHESDKLLVFISLTDGPKRSPPTLCKEPRFVVTILAIPEIVPEAPAGFWQSPGSSRKLRQDFGNPPDRLGGSGRILGIPHIVREPPEGLPRGWPGR